MHGAVVMDPADPRTNTNPKAQYRVQLPPDGRYSEWFDYDKECPYSYVLTVQFNGEFSIEESAVMSKWFSVNV